MTTLTIPSLLEILREYSLEEGLADRLDLTCADRQWLRLEATDDFELWLISWPARHRHRLARPRRRERSLHVARRLADRVHLERRAARPDPRRGAGPRVRGSHIHDVATIGRDTGALAARLPPRLTAMTRYELVRGRLAAHRRRARPGVRGERAPVSTGRLVRRRRRDARRRPVPARPGDAAPGYREVLAGRRAGRHPPGGPAGGRGRGAPGRCTRWWSSATCSSGASTRAARPAWRRRRTTPG